MVLRNGSPIFGTRLAGGLLIIAIAVSLISILAAMSLVRGFSLWDNSLSDLGVSEVAPLFNGGLVVSGVLGFLMAVSLGTHLGKGKPLRITGTAAFAGAMIALAGIGVITEASGQPHFLVSVVFFTLFLSASLLLGISMAKDQAFKDIGKMAIAAALIGILSWFLPRGDGQALPELLSILPGTVWLFALGREMAAGRLS